MEGVEARDRDLADCLRQNMLLFSDLTAMDGRSWRQLLQALPNDLWPLALKGASTALEHAVLNSLSQRARMRMEEDMAALGPQPRQKVEEARAAILRKVEMLQKQGAIIIPGKNDESMIY